MTVAAFVLIAFMLLVYVLLDGYDLGVAAVTPLVARTDRERATMMAAIGPFWNGNEVWLIAAGAVLFALFPRAYAAAFSGFYLPFIIVLWLLMFRGIAMELREHLESPLWHQFWDTAFWTSSALLIVTFGVALGNLLRGLPLDASGYFQGTFAYLLNGYAVGVGVFALVVLAQHGLAFVSLRVDGELGARAARDSSLLWWVTFAGYIAVTIATFAERDLSVSFSPLGMLAVLSIIALIALRASVAQRRDVAAFLCSCAFVATLLVEAAATLFPYLLPAYPVARGGLSIYDTQPNGVALATAMTSTLIGLSAVVAYASFVIKRMAGKIRVDE
jgi:cytochrome d ubiquinol oxidase subunit II